jgi:transcriptional regulator GlxA family with amidase domain
MKAMAARLPAPSGSSRNVVFIAYDRCQILDLAGPHEVFDAANKIAASQGREDPYEISIRSAATGDIATESGLAVASTQPLGDPTVPMDTVIVVGGDGVQDARQDPALIAWVAEAASHARRIGSVCSGAFVLAEAGVLNGRRVTTHWARAGQLAREFPTLEVDPDPIHIEDNGIWTSAGVTAGIDLALAMVEVDLGPSTAQTIGQWLVMFLRRPGGQSQFAPPIWAQAPDHNGIRRAVEQIHADPAAGHSIAELATTAAMSSRNFTRVFTREVGCPPGRYVEQIRVAAARHLLEVSDSTTDVIASRCGFGTSETMRRTFLRSVGTSPGAYRRSFAHSPIPVSPQ